MSFIERIASRLGFERRSTWRGDALGSPITASGQVVNARGAENLSTVLACVDAISTAAASLPAYVYKTVDRGRVEDPSHPMMRLITEGPNDHQSWPDWVEWMFASALLQGNGLSEIVTDGRGQVLELRPIPWNTVTVSQLPSGRLVYDVVEQIGMYGTAGRMRRLLEGEVLHLRDRSDDGLVGRSRLSRAGEVIGHGMALQEASGRLWRNGIFPSGALTLPERPGADAKKRLRASLEDMFMGSDRTGKVLILESGMEWKQLSINPEDAELLESRRFSVEELCRLYRVPPPLVQDYTHNTFTNSAQASLWFAQFSVQPWLGKMESAFRRTVFAGSDRHLEIDMSGMKRGDYEARWKAHEIALRNKVLSRNEVREIEGWNPVEGGDETQDMGPEHAPDAANVAGTAANE